MCGQFGSLVFWQPALRPTTINRQLLIIDVFVHLLTVSSSTRNPPEREAIIDSKHDFYPIRSATVPLLAMADL
jgi:hypothetical protein